MNRLRMASWLLVSTALAVTLAVIAPHLLGVSLYKLSLITTAAWVAYWIDRSLFPYARPDEFLWRPFSSDAQHLNLVKPKPTCSVVFAAAMLRRALIVSAAMIAIAIGA